MNNSVFGKTMENIRKRCNVYLETDHDHFLRQTAKPTYKGCKIFHENLVAVNMMKQRLLLNKPVYVGMCVLDLSKTLMYDFHYNFIKSKYGEKATLLFTDTDSLCYVIKTKDVYDDLFHIYVKQNLDAIVKLYDNEDDEYFDSNLDLFDNSDYPGSSKFFFDRNKKVIGKFKDEAAGQLIIEFVGLKSKMYSYKTEKKNNKTAKGVKKNVVKKDISHSHYLDCLFNNQIMHHKMRTIRSDHHVISSYEINKISLSCYDDKCYILDDGITSLAYGHYESNKGRPLAAPIDFQSHSASALSTCDQRDTQSSPISTDP